VVTNYDALGEVTTNGYNSTTHLLTSSSKPSGLVTLYTYNGSDQLESVVDLPVNRTNSYTWNSDGTMETRTDPRGIKTASGSHLGHI
jgi:YD repeat-containing protein